MAENTLYYGDNLEILRDHVAGESVDLIYLDPPFKSNQTYKVVLRPPLLPGNRQAPDGTPEPADYDAVSACR